MAEIRINATGGVKLYDADDSHYAQIVAGTITSNTDVMTLGHAAVVMGTKLDMNGSNLVLDADADTYLDTGTDDTIKFYVSGAHDLTIGANAINVLSGTTLTIDSGATITNSGTANGFGSADPSSADGDTLGTASAEWSDLYLADGGVIYFGNDQEITLTHNADDGLLLKHVGTGDGKEPSLTFQAGDNDIAQDDVLGSIFFQAPDEGAGTDAVLVAAGIEAVSEGDFSSSNNATKLSFKTAASEAASEKMSLSSAGLLTVTGGVTMTGTTPKLTIGDGGAEDTAIIFDGNETDFYIALDDSANYLRIGTGSTIGSNYGISIDNSNLETSFYGNIKAVGASATLTMGGAVAGQDTKIVFDGNAQDFYIGLDDSADDLVIGVGSSLGTTPCMSFTEDADIHMGMTAATETGIGIDPDSAPANAKLVISHNNSVAPEAHLLLHELRSGSTAQTSVSFYREDASVGNIYTTDDATTYNTSSDYRLKENLTPISDGIDRVKQLKPYRFNFIKNASKIVDGFVAHEVEEIVPQAVGGEKDAMKMQRFIVTPAVKDEDGQITEKAVMEEREVISPQSIDTSMLVPLLTGALKEAVTKIEALEARVTTLEG